MHNDLVRDLAAILLVGGLFGWAFKKFFRLPLIIGYICGGAILALPLKYGSHYGVKSETATTLADIGVLLLMFSMGLHFGVRKLKSLGKIPLFIGITQIACMWWTGFHVAQLFGLKHFQALFLGAVISMASTAVIVKLLDDFQLKSARFSEKLMGVLLVEDATAIFMIIWLSTKVSEGDSFPIWKILPVFVLCIFLWWLLGTILLPRIIQSAFRTGKEELLVILTFGFALGLAYLSSSFQFSSALGAFLMGSILSECRELKKIENLMEPVKNLFALVFFVSVGLLFDPQTIVDHWKMIFALVCTISIGKVFYNLLCNLIFGQGMKDSLRISGCMGQIGELSFVVAQVGVGLGQISTEMFSVIVVTAIFTMLLSPFSIRTALFCAERTERLFPLFFCKFIESYSQAVINLSIENKMAPLYKKLSFFSIFYSIFQGTKARLKRNYRLMTAKNVTSTLDRLAPWDEYLVPMHIGSDSQVVGQTLAQLRLRESFGVNIVAIERNSKTIVSPDADEVILGEDSLLVYGQEEAIGKLDVFCQQEKNMQRATTLDQCLLVALTLHKNHPFVGKSILDLGVRAQYNCIVLAINRQSERIKNPLSSFVFQEADELFVFGSRHFLEGMQKL